MGVQKLSLEKIATQLDQLPGHVYRVGHQWIAVSCFNHGVKRLAERLHPRKVWKYVYIFMFFLGGGGMCIFFLGGGSGSDSVFFS